MFIFSVRFLYRAVASFPLEFSRGKRLCLRRELVCKVKNENGRTGFTHISEKWTQLKNKDEKLYLSTLVQAKVREIAHYKI